MEVIAVESRLGEKEVIDVGSSIAFKREYPSFRL